jgi:hypothetical protein
MLIYLGSFYIVLAYKFCSLEISYKINLDQTFGFRKNNLDCTFLRIYF